MTTNLHLDARQRAMLAEMGVRVWLPSDAQPHATNEPLLRQAQDVQAVPVRREPPLRLPVLSTPPAVVGSTLVRYIIGNLPDEPKRYDYVILGEPCTGDAEILLANMTRLLSGNCFVAQMVVSTNESELLADQLTKLSAKVILALGPHSAKALLGEASQATPFGKLRGMVHAVEGVGGKAVVTYHPLQLLRQPLAKAQAWLDIKQAIKTTCSS